MESASLTIARPNRRTPLPWRNIVHNKVTMFVSTAAVGFAVLIMFVELGFLNGLYDSQTSVLASFRADVMMISTGLNIFNSHATFARARLEQTKGVTGVKAVYPVYVEDTLSLIRNPNTGIRNSVRVIAFDPSQPVFQSSSVDDLLRRLQAPLTIGFDEMSRPFFGRLNSGMQTELANRLVQVAGTFRLGADYYYDGNLLTSADTLFTLFPQQHRDRVFVGLIQLQPGVSSRKVVAELRKTVGPDVAVMTKSDMIAREKSTWQKATPAGYVFTMGVIVGLVIGIFICYQILYTDISANLPQLATLKAIGYRHRDLVRIVLIQAALLGLLGFFPALAVTTAVYGVLTAATGIVTKLTLGRIALVFVLTIGMCLAAGLLAVRKAIAADPAELF